MNKTKIEYLDFTWNPIVGCTGEGCAVRDVCWAKGMGKRRLRECKDCYVFWPHSHPERLTQPLHRKKSAVIGVCFMGDLYDHKITEEQRHKVYNTIRLAHWHKFVGLTKQPNRINLDELKDLSNFWLGVTVNRKKDLWRMDDLWKLSQLQQFPHRWVSFEPLYEDMGEVNLKGIEGIVIGAQTRPNCQPDWTWVASLAKQARQQGVKVFLKNNIATNFYNPEVHQLLWRF